MSIECYSFEENIKETIIIWETQEKNLHISRFATVIIHKFCDHFFNILLKYLLTILVLLNKISKTYNKYLNKIKSIKKLI